MLREPVSGKSSFLKRCVRLARRSWRLPYLSVISDTIFDLALRVNSDYLSLSARAAEMPIRKILVAAVDVPVHRDALARVESALSETRHKVSFLRAPMGDRGKFDNINLVVANTSMEQYDWLIVVDDDVALPPNFLDRFLYLSEKANLVLSQPAHRINSYQSWRVSSRTWRNLVRTTHFVECGPFTAFHSSFFADVLPFPGSRWGWGLDFIWSETARRRNLKIGVVDATPIRHTRPVAASYNYVRAREEANKLMQAFDVTRCTEEYMTTTGAFRRLDSL